MNFNGAELAALDSSNFRLGVFFRLATDPVVRLWLGFGNIEPGVNAYDLSGALYRGCGELLDVPAFRQLLNGAAERVRFGFSGVSGDVLSIAAGEASIVKGKAVAVGVGIMAQGWTLIGEIRWCAFYVADYLSIDQSAAAPGQAVTRSVGLSCGSRFTGRRRPSLSYLSDQDQQARYPGDLFCNLVGNYAHGFSKQWPTFS